MKNIQVIDSADNCKYNIYAIPDTEFELMFPNGADIEFIEDFISRVDKERATQILEKLWKRQIEKSSCNGIHGTLFYQLSDIKREYYPNKRFSDDKYG